MFSVMGSLYRQQQSNCPNIFFFFSTSKLASSFSNGEQNRYSEQLFGPVHRTAPSFSPAASAPHALDLHPQYLAEKSQSFS